MNSTTTPNSSGAAGLPRAVWIGGGLMGLTIIALATTLVVKGNSNDIGRVRGVEASVHGEYLVREVERVELARGSGRLADRALVGARDQNDGGPPGIAQRLKRLAKAVLLHLQS